MIEKHPPHERESVEMPTPTIAPLVLSLAIALVAVGVATSMAFVVVGAVLFIVGLTMWAGQLLPGSGHAHEPLVAAELRPKAVAARLGKVERLRPGMAGYRLRLPEKVHPISAGVKGGIVGGLAMVIPAMLYGLFSGHGIWLPVNLLCGMVLPGIGRQTLEQLGTFQPTHLVIGTAIHATVSLITGLMYGVLMPTLPRIHRPLAWGALLMPLLWTAASFVILGYANPAVRELIEWPWFVVSQFIFGVVAAIVFMTLRNHGPISAGLLGGIAGGLLMPIPAVLWGILSKHTAWFPINLLAAMVVRYSHQVSVHELEQFHRDWFISAAVAHVGLSLLFGLAFGFVLPHLPKIPAAFAWGGMLLPLFWTSMSYALMGIVNPVLQQRVDWPWFIASQFVFGIVAATVVTRSQEVHIPPAGQGPDRRNEFVAN
jgi:hypothetical protein